jgi:hypothetical protein
MAFGMKKHVISAARGNGPRFQSMEVTMRKHRDFENLPCFQRLA